MVQKRFMSMRNRLHHIKLKVIELDNIEFYLIPYKGTLAEPI